MIGLDWSNESYNRLYRNDSVAWKLVGLEGQCVYMGILRKLDRSGVLPLNGVPMDEAVAALLNWPIDFCRVGLERIIGRGMLVHESDCLIDPEYLEREETAMSNSQRKREYRERRRLEKLGRLQNVDHQEQNVDKVSTGGNAEERGGTPSLALPSVPSLPDQEEKNGKPMSPQQEAVAAVWAIYDRFTAERPAAGVALNWWKQLKSNTRHLEECLKSIGPKGYLGKGDAYVFSVVKGWSQGKKGPPTPTLRPPTVDELRARDRVREEEL